MTNGLKPETILAACDAEAEVWAAETDLAGMVAKMTSDPRSAEKLIGFAKMCFVEGVYRGATNVIDGKSLAESIMDGPPAGTC